MKTLIERIAQEQVWGQWIALNSSANAGCVSGVNEGRSNAMKDGCISIASGKSLAKTGCIS